MELLQGQEEQHMDNDAGWKEFFSDDGRYADIINGIGCKGRQVIRGEDLAELDSQTGFWRGAGLIRSLPGRRRVKLRDSLRRAAFGVNFAVVGIENQEGIDYSLPLRDCSYEVGEYEKQAAKIRREVRKAPKGLSRGEYLYGFRKDSRLHPAVTFILYYGKEPWDGPRTLHEMLDFTDIPEELSKMVGNHRINLVEIRKLEDTSIFRTDVRQVFAFIRCSEDKAALAELVTEDSYYKNMEEDAFDIVVQYTSATELIGAKEYYRKDGKVDMCTAITQLIADGRSEGLNEGLRIGKNEGQEEKTRIVVKNMLRRGMPDREIMAVAECSQELVDEIRRRR